MQTVVVLLLILIGLVSLVIAHKFGMLMGRRMTEAQQKPAKEIIVERVIQSPPYMIGGWAPYRGGGWRGHWEPRPRH
jgi:hypothetical protein